MIKAIKNFFKNLFKRTKEPFPDACGVAGCNNTITQEDHGILNTDGVITLVCIDCISGLGHTIINSINSLTAKEK